MLCFPQLLGGAPTQFPTRRRIEKRTVWNRQSDGRVWKLADAQWRRVEWRLELKGLRSEEYRALETLFHQVEGRRGSFVFLDPLGNLLVWSEDLEREAWAKDRYLELTMQADDPWGSSSATRLRNAGAIPQRIQQVLSAPSWFHYCLSLWVRSNAVSELTVFAQTSTAAAARTVKTNTSWQRVVHPVRLQSTDESVAFGVELGAGVTIEVCGLQVEAQCGASKYKKTGERSGVYREARFCEDRLVVGAEAPESHCCTVKVMARA